MTFKAIETKYHGPGNVRGSRIIASDMDKNRVIASYDYALSAEENHKAAAYALCSKMNWGGSLIGGATSRGYVWVFADYERKQAVAS